MQSFLQTDRDMYAYSIVGITELVWCVDLILCDPVSSLNTEPFSFFPLHVPLIDLCLKVSEYRLNAFRGNSIYGVDMPCVVISRIQYSMKRKKKLYTCIYMNKNTKGLFFVLQTMTFQCNGNVRFFAKEYKSRSGKQPEREQESGNCRSLPHPGLFSRLAVAVESLGRSFHSLLI